MSQRTKQYLRETLIYGHLVSGQDFTDLVDSLKGLQTPVADPSPSGSGVSFIATIEQDEEGVITVTKKTVDLSPYQTVAGMSDYQPNDLQQVGSLTVTGDNSDVTTSIAHGMRHYPTVRVMDSNGVELRDSETLIAPYTVQHVDENTVKITLKGPLNDGSIGYKYILD